MLSTFIPPPLSAEEALGGDTYMDFETPYTRWLLKGYNLSFHQQLGNFSSWELGVGSWMFNKNETWSDLTVRLGISIYPFNFFTGDTNQEGV